MYERPARDPRQQQSEHEPVERMSMDDVRTECAPLVQDPVEATRKDTAGVPRESQRTSGCAAIDRLPRPREERIYLGRAIRSARGAPVSSKRAEPIRVHEASEVRMNGRDAVAGPRTIRQPDDVIDPLLASAPGEAIDDVEYPDRTPALHLSADQQARLLPYECNILRLQQEGRTGVRVRDP